MSKCICSICGYIHDEEEGYPEGNIPPNTPWSDIPSTFTCPLCGAFKEDFVKQEDSSEKQEESKVSDNLVELPEELDYSSTELSAIFSNLSKGSEKQYDFELATMYNQLSLYYKVGYNSKVQPNFDKLKQLVDIDIDSNFTMANNVANKFKDRGALRALKWSEQVSKMINSHLKKLTQGSFKFLEDSNLYVCEICGFIHIGKEKPKICPVCKVPNIKMTQIKRGA